MDFTGSGGKISRMMAGYGDERMQNERREGRGGDKSGNYRNQGFERIMGKFCINNFLTRKKGYD